MIHLGTEYLKKFITSDEISSFKEKIALAHKRLHENYDSSGDFKGWVELPNNFDKSEIDRIKAVAEKIRNNSDVFIVIGIGGSYLGARAAIEFLNSENYNLHKTPKIFFVGNAVSSCEIKEILDFCSDKDISVNVISKSGTTLEPAIAFNIFKKFIEDKYGKDKAKSRIFCTTDDNKRILKNIADIENYECFKIPDNIGGRYSVLTAVGLLPIAVSGANIDDILIGAQKSYEDFKVCDIEKNACYKYAILRNILYNKNKFIEVLVGYEPKFRMFCEWWKQLFGESEGKNNKGIFPASMIFSTDLHSLGQFIQEGNKILFETILMVEKDNYSLKINVSDKNLDGLNYIENKTLDEINKNIFLATANAHYSGNVPNIILKIKDNKEYDLGYLIYFFEKACAISGYLLGVNPFNQPGVEEYKKNMFKLLGKHKFKEKG